MRLLAQFAGDVPDMARAEFLAVFEAHGAPLTIVREAPRFLDGHSDVFEDEVRPVLQRLGLTQLAAMFLFEGRPDAWPPEARECCFPTGVSFACRAVRVDPESPWSGPKVEREVGELLYTDSRPVDLKRPQQLVRPFLFEDRVVVGQQLLESDPKPFQARHVENRPFFSPVSLEPRLARALVNLSRVAPGQTLYDPFCGTGGILLEAASMGVKAYGSDIDAEMVEGALLNLAHFGLKGNAFVADVDEGPGQLQAQGVRRVDAVVSDLPYGRSSSTAREGVAPLHARAMDAIDRILRPGGHAVLGVPDPGLLRPPPSFQPVDTFRVRAHKSLTRHFVVFSKSKSV